MPELMARIALPFGVGVRTICGVEVHVPMVAQRVRPRDAVCVRDHPIIRIRIQVHGDIGRVMPRNCSRAYDGAINFGSSCVLARALPRRSHGAVVLLILVGAVVPTDPQPTTWRVDCPKRVGEDRTLQQSTYHDYKEHERDNRAPSPSSQLRHRATSQKSTMYV